MFPLYVQFSNGYKLFGNIGVPIYRIASISLCMLGGYFGGMYGILGAQTLTTVLLLHIWSPYYLFRKGFQQSFIKYILIFIQNAVILVGAFIVSTLFCKFMMFNVETVTSWSAWILNAVVFTLTLGLVSFCVSCISQHASRNLVMRLIRANTK